MNESTSNASDQSQNENSMQDGQAPQEPVTVSMKKLIAGVGTVFAGVIEMLEALEPHVAHHLVDVAVQNAADRKKSVEPEAVQPRDERGSNTVSGPAADAEKNSVSEDADQKDVSAPVVMDRHKEAEQQATPEVAAVNTVTEDDLTKIIVRKIKQNRSNNEKIGAILRTYGVSKVSELPVSKYEAFLTDVSQL